MNPSSPKATAPRPTPRWFGWKHWVYSPAVIQPNLDEIQDAPQALDVRGSQAVTGASVSTYQETLIVDVDRGTNLAWNRARWGQRAGWEVRDHYGYRWGGGYAQTVGDLVRFTDKFLRPWTFGRYDLNIMELSPGGGRFTSELLRYASKMALVDMSSDCIEVCRERFRYFPTRISYHVNDGTSLAAVEGAQFDLIACYDSMVHMHPTVIEGYVRQMAGLVRANGVIWLDHSGMGRRESGHRTAMTAETMREIAARAGLRVVDQTFRNDWDCVSVLRRADWKRANRRAIRNRLRRLTRSGG